MPKQVNIEGTVLPIEELHFSFITHALRHKFGFLESSRDNIPKDSNGEIIPLYTYPCQEWLNSIGWETSRVFEYGSGYSTLWWSNKGADVYGVEHDEEWFKKTPDKKFVFETEPTGYGNSILQHTQGFDIIVIDGAWRSACIEPALTKLDEHGMIILDNSDMFIIAKEELDSCEDLIPVHFHGFKPIHVESETTSCYLKRGFRRKPKNIIPIGGTKRDGAI